MVDYILAPALQSAETPSAKDFVHVSTEAETRCLAWEILRTAAMLLKVDIAVATRAMTYVHRLYATQSLRAIDVWDSTRAALILALKLEETQYKIKNVIRVFLLLQHRFLDMPAEKLRAELTGPDAVQKPSAGTFGALTIPERMSTIRKALSEMNMDAVIDSIARSERHILRSMGYVCAVNQPHAYVRELCAVAVAGLESRKNNESFPTSGDIECFSTEDVGFLDAYIQKAWSYVNDSFATALCCRFPAAKIACGAVYLTACGSVTVDETSAEAKVPAIVQRLLSVSGTTADELVEIAGEMHRVAAQTFIPRYFAINTMDVFKERFAALEKAKQNRLRATSNHQRLDARLRQRSGGGASAVAESSGSDALEMLAMAGILSPAPAADRAEKSSTFKRNTLR